MPIWLLNLLIGLALQVAGQLLSNMARGKADQPGVRTTLDAGGDLSPRFIVGHYATAGQLRYAGTWGTVGGTPNAYFSQAIEVSCLPIRGFSGWYVDGERVTLAAVKTGDLGYAVLEKRVKGKDYLWINPYLGAQTAPDPLMLAKFGADPDRPYAGMVGRGCGYFVVTALVNRELFPGKPEILAEVDGIALDDPRGDAQHDNPIVAAYTLLKGLSHDGEWVYGPQGIGDANFDLGNIEAEADKCDADRALAGGGTEKRYRIGLDVALDEEPHAIVEELLKGCAGRWADLGGRYRFLVGAPDEPVISFTDEDVLISAGQSYEPFPGLDALHNGMTATYPDPAAAWTMTEAPPRYSSALEDEDDGRRLVFSTEFRAVPYPVQVQELMRTTIEDARRFRRHTFTAPPNWWGIEPLDTVSWTSARNGYVDKRFLVTLGDDLPNGNQFVGLQEIDPSDYGWSSALQLPTDVAPLTVARPAPQTMTGFSVAPAVIEDNDGNPRRPTVEVGYPGGLDDVRAVRVQARLAGATGPMFDGELPYDAETPSPSALLNAPMASATAYEVRGKLLPYSGRETLWSNQDSDGTEGAWLSVTTPYVPEVGPGAVDWTVLATDVQGIFNWIGATSRELVEAARQSSLLAAEQDLENYDQVEGIKRTINVQFGNLQASFDEFIEAAIGPGGAITLLLTTIFAALGGNSSQVMVRWEAIAAPEGVEARWALQLRVSGDVFGSAGIYLDLKPDGTSTLILDATKSLITTDGGLTFEAMFNEDGAFIRDLTTGTIRSEDGNSFWNLTTGAFRIAVP